MSMQVVLPQPGHTTQRRWPRYSVDVPVQVVTHGPMKIAVAQGRGSALNCGGMAVSSEVNLSIGEQIAVEFTPPHTDQAVRVRCFVRNRQRYSYGVEFITESDADYENVGLVETALRHMISRVQ
jgi:PilZ domain